MRCSRSGPASAITAGRATCMPARAPWPPGPTGVSRPRAAELQDPARHRAFHRCGIAAFCFGERIAILDGNVKRVLGRLLAFPGDLASSASGKAALWQHAQALLPAPEDIEAYTQGLMDLGATVCTPRSPQCLICPVRDLLCTGARGAASPRSTRCKTRKLKRSAAVENWWLLLAREGRRCSVVGASGRSTGVWAGLCTACRLFESDAAAAVACAYPGAGHSPIDGVPFASNVRSRIKDWVHLHPRGGRSEYARLRCLPGSRGSG